MLGDASDEHPFRFLQLQRSLLLNFLDDAADDFPLVSIPFSARILSQAENFIKIFYAYQVALSPRSFSLTSVALMQQAASSLAWTISSIVSGQDTIGEQLNDIKTLYETSHIQNNMKDGELRYPQDCNEISSGMEISFK